MTDSILTWNAVALEANRVSHTDPGKLEQRGPTLSSRTLAIIHLAMYDAYAAVVNDTTTLPPYLGVPLPPVPAGATPAAAAAGAAHAALVALYPLQQTTFDLQLALVQSSDPGNPGYAFGAQVAAILLAERAGDPGAGAAGYVPKTGRGFHREDPDDPGQGFYSPFYGAQSKGFAITARHELDAPPALDSTQYIRALRQVREKGIRPDLMATLPDVAFPRRRNMDETVIGIYWGYDGSRGLGTPPRLYNQIIRVLAMARNNSEAQNARLFALVNAAMGDAGILAWDQKYLHDLWRPVLGIREHDASFGPAPTESDNNINNDADPGWLPLGAPNTNAINASVTIPAVRAKNVTPPFPAYPSGHATFGAAAFHIARRFYGVTQLKKDDLFDGLSFVSDEFDGFNQDNTGTVRPRHNRDFPDGLWQMIVENGLSRVYLGVHWFYDAFALKNNGDPDVSENVGGVPLGIAIANDIFDSGMKQSTVGPRS